ncbi:MAG: hypothetical protein AAB333_06600, partial [Pseudomonadota bacterium]
MSCLRKMRTMISKGPFALLAGVLGAALLGAVSLWLVERELIARTGVSLAFGAAEVAGKLDVMLQERDGDIQVLA